jgi:hypothetical protein
MFFVPHFVKVVKVIGTSGTDDAAAFVDAASGRPSLMTKTKLAIATIISITLNSRCLKRRAKKILFGVFIYLSPQL